MSGGWPSLLPNERRTTNGEVGQLCGPPLSHQRTRLMSLDWRLRSTARLVSTYLHRNEKKNCKRKTTLPSAWRLTVPAVLEQSPRGYLVIGSLAIPIEMLIKTSSTASAVCRDLTYARTLWQPVRPGAIKWLDGRRFVCDRGSSNNGGTAPELYSWLPFNWVRIKFKHV